MMLFLSIMYHTLCSLIDLDQDCVKGSGKGFCSGVLAESDHHCQDFPEEATTALAKRGGKK